MPSSATSTPIDAWAGAVPGGAGGGAGGAGPVSVAPGDGSIWPGRWLGGESSVHVLPPLAPTAAGVASKAYTAAEQ